MREIEFRGKRIDNGEWVYGSYQADVMYTGKHTIIYSDNEGFYCEDEVDPKTVGQYTGPKDKNGKEIYEGDIVTCEVNEHGEIVTGIDEGTPITGQVVFENGAFVVLDEAGELLDFWMVCEIKVIGNIHENLELLNDLE